MNIASKIRAYRTNLSMSQEMLAQRAKIPYATLVKIEGGKVLNPTIKTLVKIAKALNIKIDDLIE